eukprot:scaffold8141_cov430-Prasinococcus_capsulatus_cf.AAC.4
MVARDIAQRRCQGCSRCAPMPAWRGKRRMSARCTQLNPFEDELLDATQDDLRSLCVLPRTRYVGGCTF